MGTWGYSDDELRSMGAYDTATEIYRQPQVWKMIYQSIAVSALQIRSFLAQITRHEKFQVVLTGAGSSSFIGLSIQGAFSRSFGRYVASVPTTHLVTHPLDYLSPEMPVLLISFARSGNSPESIAAARIADQLCSRVYHLIITCDVNGRLANLKTNSAKYVFVLPAQANDQSLAMTVSYSGMLLAGLLIARLAEIDNLKGQIEILASYGIKLLNRYADFREIASLDFKRAVFLGSGPLLGTATESQLKLQELTDGHIICKSDSFLGFRHGPKAVTDEQTLVFYLFSNQPYVMQYEKDLVESMKKGKKALYQAGLMESRNLKVKLDKEILLSGNGEKLDEDFLPVCSIIPAQMLGFFKCLQLGLQPDSPSASGAISRVVQGVEIYPYNLPKR
jgi:tagatose-6-phosphate ketose/aldose isomerase